VSQSFKIYFECRGFFDFILFRVTSDDPSDCYGEFIIYPHDKRKKYQLYIEDFDTSRPVVVEFNIFTAHLQLHLSNVYIDFNLHKGKLISKAREEIHLPSFIKKYNRNSIVRDYDFFSHPDPHSHERGLAVLKHLNYRSETTIDLGAGCAPLISDLVLRNGKGTIDCLVYGNDDTLRAKRLLSKYTDRANVFCGDLINPDTIPNKKYDQILLIDVLEHIENDLQVLENIKKLFHANSKLIISVPNINYKTVFSQEFHHMVGHLRDGYSILGLTKILKSSGFSILFSKNYSLNTKNFYEFWYKDIKAWNNSFRYSDVAFNEANQFLSKLKSTEIFNQQEEGVSNLFVCTLDKAA
jgi:SAM-dependent methyltransferase